MIRKRLLRNTTYGMAAQATGVLSALFVTPLIIRFLGLSTYGLWTLATSFVGFFGLTDLGLRHAIGRFIALHNSRNENEKINHVIATALLILTGCSLVIAAATLVCTWLFPRVFHIAADQTTTAAVLVLLTGLSVAVSMCFDVFDAVLVGFGRYDWLYQIEIGAGFARVVAVVALLLTGNGVIAIVSANVAVSIAAGFVKVWLAFKQFPPLRLALSECQLATAKELYGLGIWSFVNMLWVRLAFMTDNVVVGWALDTKAVAIYSIAGRLIALAVAGADAFSNVLMPFAVSFHGTSDDAKQRRLLLEGTKASLFYVLLIATVFIICGAPIIVAWVGPSFHESANVLWVLTLPVICFVAAKPASIVLFSMGSKTYRWVAAIYWVDAAANLTLSIILVKLWGMIGVAYGTMFTMTISLFLVLPLFTCRVLHITYFEYLRRTYLTAIGVIVPLSGLLLGAMYLWHPSRLMPLAAILVCIGGAYYGTVYYWYARHRPAPAIQPAGAAPG